MDQGLSEEPSPASSNSEAAGQGHLEEPSPVTNSEAITPASGVEYVDFTLFPSSSSSEETDMDFEAQAFFGVRHTESSEVVSRGEAHLA